MMPPSKDGGGCEWVGVLCMLGRGGGTQEFANQLWVALRRVRDEVLKITLATALKTELKMEQ